MRPRMEAGVVCCVLSRVDGRLKVRQIEDGPHTGHVFDWRSFGDDERRGATSRRAPSSRPSTGDRSQHAPSATSRGRNPAAAYVGTRWK